MALKDMEFTICFYDRDCIQFTVKEEKKMHRKSKRDKNRKAIDKPTTTMRLVDPLNPKNQLKTTTFVSPALREKYKNREVKE